MGNSIDLHIHSAASDGSDAVPALLNQIRAAGIQTFSVTDHDTIDGTLEMQKLVPEDLRFIPGVEFSCVTAFKKCHILGYGFDPDDPVLQEILARGNALRQEKFHTRAAFLESQFGIILTEEELAELSRHSSPGKPHFANLLVKRGLAPDRSAAIKTYLNPCKTRHNRMDAAEAIHAILHAGGIPVWAHPLGGEGETWLTEAEFHSQLEILMDQGIRGMECFYSRYDDAQIGFLTRQAHAHRLLISAGSDYHGSNKSNLPLGKLNAKNAEIHPRHVTILSEL